MKSETNKLQSIIRLIKFACISIMFVVLLTGNCFAQSVTWEKTYLRSNWTSGYSVKQTSDGNFISCGLRTNYGGFVVKLNQLGDTLWVRYFPVAELTSIVETNDGKYVTVGWTNNAYIVKLDLNGSIIWTREFNEPGYDISIYNLCITIDGGFAAVGEARTNGPTTLSGYLLRIDANGNKLWSKIYSTTSNFNVLYSVKEIQPNGFILSGGEYVNGNNQIYLIKTYANGDTLWTKSFGTSYAERGYTIFQTLDKGFLSIGYIFFGGAQIRLYFSKIDSLGNLLWAKIYGDTLKNYEIRSSDCAAFNPNDNSYLITGRYETGTSSLDTTKLFILSIDTLGNRLWEKLYYKDTADIEGASIDLCNDSGYVVVGDLLDPPINNSLTSPQLLYIVKTNKFGEINPIGININTGSLPVDFKLHQNYPNPFNPETNIKYEIPKDANVSIKIYDMLGREVFSISEFKQAGSYEIQFDGINFASGMYFYKLFVGDPSTGSGREYTETKKMVLFK